MDGSDVFDGDEDAALRYAIALSLQESGGHSSEKPIEIGSDDDDDDDLDKGPKYPPIVRGASSQPTRPSLRDATPKDVPKPMQQCTSTTAVNTFATLGLDRKKMEEERLARLRKRKASESDAGDQDRRQRPKLDTEARIDSTAESNPRRLPFPKGVVKKTWAAGFPREDDIKIEEVLQKDELELAVLSSFQWDEEWMLSKIDITKTRIVCIAFASSEAQQEEMKANVPASRIRFCFPPMMPAGNMHSKLQLLKYPGYLRIVVPSGNLVPFDWGETGSLENMVFLVDLPRIEDAESRAINNLNEFGEELCYFLRAQGLNEKLVASLANYDFSETDRYRFIHTIGTSHVGDKWQRTGYCGLGRAVASLGLNTDKDIEVDFVTSSLGSLNREFLTAIYFAAQGDDGLKEYGMRASKGAKRKAPEPTGREPDLESRFRIYFPSRDTVVRSRLGENSKWWDAATFPRALVRDCQSTRPGLLMHNKLMLVRPSPTTSPSSSSSGEERSAGGAYAYVGSANLSESAWGRLTKERGTGNPKLTCRNWECGVLVPVRAPTTSGKDLAATFEGVVPVPMGVPAEAYAASRRPWLYLES
ncbi:phospholipase D/nuclease [Durotheca rogersii]|uniref:phospholipase D/nuclease n=1 Tax=Durotheca rogersii TaxID=419775 RepID=UPI0022207DF0|nr:phospholipase D/nuclease [Durotheca rogersii]KAI5859333.1 phospholipase D/nuclease [Durotheca rogersii]